MTSIAIASPLMKYQMNDGQQYPAGTPEALIEAMQQDDKFNPMSTEEFMVQTSQRCLMQKGAAIPVDSAEAFVNGLIEAGFITVIGHEHKVKISASARSLPAGSRTPYGTLSRDLAYGDTVAWVEADEPK